MLHVTVETITGKSFKLRVSPLETVYFVKVKICQREGIPIGHQILIWKSIELNNDNTLASYNIPNNSTLKLTLTMKGGPINSALTDEQSFQDIIEYLAEPSDIPTSSSSSSSSLVSEKKHGAVILCRYGKCSLKIPSTELMQPEAYSIEKWRLKFEDLKIKNERQIENNKLRGNMASLRKKMQRIALDKMKKAKFFPNVPSTSTDSTDEALGAKCFYQHSTNSQNSPSLNQISSDQQNSEHYAMVSADQIKFTHCSKRHVKSDEGVNNGCCESYPLFLKNLNSLKPEFVCNGVEVPWNDGQKIRALADLHCRNLNSSNVSISSSNTNLEETSINEDDVDKEGEDGTLNALNSVELKVSKHVREEMSPTESELKSPNICLSMELRNLMMGNSNTDTSRPAVGIYTNETIVKDNQKNLLPILAESFTESNLKCHNKIRLPAKNDAFNPLSPAKSYLKFNLTPSDRTFLEPFQQNRMRKEKSKDLFTNGNSKTILVNSCNLISECNNSKRTDKGNIIKKFDELECDLKRDESQNSDQISPHVIHRLPSIHTFHSKDALTSQTSFKTASKSSRGCATTNLKSQVSEKRSEHDTHSFSLLPPIQAINSHVMYQANEGCLSKLSSPKSSTKKAVPIPESFSPFKKRRTRNCLSNSNYSGNHAPWKNQHILWCTSGDEESASDACDACGGSADLGKDFSTLKMPGSLLSSDLSGCKVRVKKIAGEKKLMKMLEVVNRESHGSKTLGRTTGYIISTPSHLTPERAMEFSKPDDKTLLHSITDKSNVIAQAPKKKCAVCNKKTMLGTGFICRCGQNFCSSHRYPEEHICSINYRLEGRKVLEERNQVVSAPKLPKI